MTPPATLLGAGIELMLAGMGTVLLFLTLLVLATLAMSSLVQKVQQSVPPVAADPSAEELAAISAAIHQHRRSQD